jgi:hypothetical protein
MSTVAGWAPPGRALLAAVLTATVGQLAQWKLVDEPLATLDHGLVSR